MYVHPNINYKYLGDKACWRDSSSFLNKGLKQALECGYKYIFITHPEIIPGKTTIENAKKLAVDKENNKLGILPLLESDKNATKIKCLTGGYMFENAADATSARYIIQCQLVYDQDY